MIRRRSIRSVLFATYSVIIALILSISLLLFYLWSSDTLRKQASDSISGMSQSVREKLDLEIQKIDTVSQNILYSNLVKERFLVFAGKDQSAGLTQAESMIQATKELAEILVAANGPALPVQQINLYDFAGNMFGSGFDNRRMKVDLESLSWYDAVMNGYAGKVITIPEIDEQLRNVLPTSENSYSISLIRTFFDRYNAPEGIVEVKQSLRNLFKGLNLSQHDRVIVYNDEGVLIYPAGPEHEGEKRYLPAFLAKPEGGSVKNPDTGEPELYQVSRSEFTGWNSAVIRPEKTFSAPLRTFTTFFILFAVCILALAFALAYWAAQRVTKPIARLHQIIKTTDLDGLSSPSSFDLSSGLNELDRLQFAFGKMGDRLRYSMEQLMQAQKQQLQAKMLALQSQMNPHFLYNTLATLGVMAEENMNEEIVEMIENLSDLMRYISADETSVVDLETELAHTEKFLRCVGFRYGSRLTFEVESDPSLRKIPVSKLIVQPLVENAVKYCTKAAPPWRIRIRVYAEGELWFAEVQDNGPGFDDEKLKSLRESIERIEQSGQTPSLKVEGMGLLNVYIRLKILYGARMSFKIDNPPEGGAVVTIGGTQTIGGNDK